MKTIETARVVLRNFAPEDAEGLLAYMREPRASCFMSGKLDDLDAAISDVRSRAESDDAIAVALKSSGELIGDMFCMFEEPDTFSVGWNFNAAFEGKGLASEAARALLDHLFTDRGARRIFAYVEVTNPRSQALCERLGMRKEGVFREFISFINDAAGNPIYEDTMQYALLRREWVGQA